MEADEKNCATEEAKSDVEKSVRTVLPYLSESYHHIIMSVLALFAIKVFTATGEFLGTGMGCV